MPGIKLGTRKFPTRQILATAVLAALLSGVGASPSWAVFVADLGTIPVPGTARFGNNVSVSPFDNDFQFTIGASAPVGSANAIEIELLPTFEINSFTLSLFNAAVPATTPPSKSGAPLATAVATVVPFPGTTATHAASITFPALGPGSYILNIMGTAIGTLGGSYAGNIAVVPLPAAFWLFASGMVGLGLAWRRRSVAQAT